MYAAMIVLPPYLQIFFPSPRNSLEAHLSLLEGTKSERFLLPKANAPPIIKEILSKRTMQVHEVPDLDVLLNAEQAPLPV